MTLFVVGETYSNGITTVRILSRDGYLLHTDRGVGHVINPRGDRRVTTEIAHIKSHYFLANNEQLQWLGKSSNLGDHAASSQ